MCAFCCVAVAQEGLHRACMHDVNHTHASIRDEKFTAASIIPMKWANLYYIIWLTIKVTTVALSFILLNQTYPLSLWHSLSASRIASMSWHFHRGDMNIICSMRRCTREKSIVNGFFRKGNSIAYLIRRYGRFKSHPVDRWCSKLGKVSWEMPETHMRFFMEFSTFYQNLGIAIKRFTACDSFKRS